MENTPNNAEAIETIEPKTYSKIMRVKADPKDATPEQRKAAMKALAGAISHAVKDHGEVEVRCLSPDTIVKATKSIATARGYVAMAGHDLFCAPHWINAEANTESGQLTGIGFYLFTNKVEPSASKLYPDVISSRIDKA